MSWNEIVDCCVRLAWSFSSWMVIWTDSASRSIETDFTIPSDTDSTMIPSGSESELTSKPAVFSASHTSCLSSFMSHKFWHINSIKSCTTRSRSSTIFQCWMLKYWNSGGFKGDINRLENPTKLNSCEHKPIEGNRVNFARKVNYCLSTQITSLLIHINREMSKVTAVNRANTPWSITVRKKIQRSMIYNAIGTVYVWCADCIIATGYGSYGWHFRFNLKQ